MADLFKQIIPSLLSTKKDCLEDEKDYVPFVVNKAISQYVDGIFYANEMNRYPELPKRAQYDFYFHSLAAKKRPFVKWSKPEKEQNIELIKQYFNYSDKKAREVLNIISQDQLVMIRNVLTVGVEDE